uniref:hypothetical protein n=1 Tax=Candidatus Electronema sp. TaxID=2698783 RepID=UPI0040561A62
MTQKSLEEGIEHEAKRAGRYGYANYTAAYLVALLSVVGSVVASGLAAFEANKVLTASIAAIPAFVAAITRVFNFEQKALWHWGKHHRYRSLLRSLKWEGSELKEISKQYSKEAQSWNNAWVNLNPLQEIDNDKNP